MHNPCMQHESGVFVTSQSTSLRRLERNAVQFFWRFWILPYFYHYCLISVPIKTDIIHRNRQLVSSSLQSPKTLEGMTQEAHLIELLDLRRPFIPHTYSLACFLPNRHFAFSSTRGSSDYELRTVGRRCVYVPAVRPSSPSLVCKEDISNALPPRQTCTRVANCYLRRQRSHRRSLSLVTQSTTLSSRSSTSSSSKASSCRNRTRPLRAT